MTNTEKSEFLKQLEREKRMRQESDLSELLDTADYIDADINDILEEVVEDDGEEIR